MFSSKTRSFTVQFAVVLAVIPAVMLIVFALVLGGPTVAGAFGGCDSNCANCHKLTKEEATELIKAFDPKASVENVQQAPSKGLWELTVKGEKGKGIVYLDYSKGNLISGQIIKIKTKKNLTAEKLSDIQRVDISTIPIQNALYLGDTKAKHILIVFTDPDCPYCRNFHKEINETLKKRKDVGFYIVLYPLTPIHPDSYRKSKTIICEKSIKLLNEAVEGKAIPDPKCDTRVIDENIKLAEKTGITGTPTVIMPDGRIVRGALKMEDILKKLENK
ncbi:MAG: DsbC family protein [Nitrospirae bacterium]|nr:DsbC family protein [Nitrospirota bacterium]